MNIIPKSSWLVKDNTKSIREKSIDVKLPLSKHDEEVMEKLIAFVKQSQDEVKNKNKELTPAVGLAAPQIGENLNMYYIKLTKQTDNSRNIEYALINPKIIGKTENQTVALETGEGCLSVNKQKKGYVHRSYKIIIEAYDYFTKKNIKINASKYEAIVLQHEQDHLDGTLYYDYINKKDPWKIKINAIYL